MEVRHRRECHGYFNLWSSAVCTENTCDFPRARCCSGYDMMQDTGMALSAWLQETDCREEYMGEPRVNRRHDSAARRSQCDTRPGLSIRWSNRLPRAVMFKGRCAELLGFAASQSEASLKNCRGEWPMVEKPITNPACMFDPAAVHINGYVAGSSTHEKARSHRAQS